MEAICYSDGASRGNPGVSGAGALIRIGKETIRRSIKLGICTNNVAEFIGAYTCLDTAVKAGANFITIYSDSTLLVNTFMKHWKQKDARIKEVAAKIKKLMMGRSVQFVWIPREQNTEADYLSNVACDAQPDVKSLEVYKATTQSPLF